MSCWDRDYRNKVCVGFGVGFFYLFFVAGGGVFFLAICSQLSSSLSPHSQGICVIRKKKCCQLMTGEVKLGMHGANIS